MTVTRPAGSARTLPAEGTRTAGQQAAAAPAVQPDGSTWLLGNRFMLRVAGLPFGVLASLRCGATLSWADAVLDGERGLTRAAAVLSDMLYEAVHGSQRDQDRRALLTLRRQVFNNKLPADPEAALRLAEAAAGPAGPELAAWLRDRTRWEQLRARGPVILAAETGAARGRLRALASDPRLRHGLLLASPSLDAALGSYLRRESGDLGKRERRTERALLEYVHRVAAKTSPFSTFTGVALGEFTSSDGAASQEIYAQSVPEQWQCYPRVNVAVLSRLADLIADDDARRGDLPVALTTGWNTDAGRVRYVRLTTVRGDDEAAVSFDFTRDDVFFLRHGAALGDLLDLLGRQPGLRYGEFITRLSEALGEPPGECDRYARKLLKLGLLRAPALRVDIHHRDPLRDLAQRLLRLDRPWAADLSARLGRIAAGLDDYAEAGLPGRRAILQQVRTGFEEIHAALGAPGASLPRTLVLEDVRAGQAILGCDRERWTAQIAEPLRALGSILPLFDLALAHRITLRGFFLARYGRGGRCDDLLRLVREFHEDIYDYYLKVTRSRRAFDDQGNYVPHENWLRLPELGTLDAARVAFAGHMRALWDGAAGAEELVLGDDVLTEIAGLLAPLTARFRAEGHFVQVGRRGGAPLAVLNRSFSGLSFPFSRFTHCFEDAGPQGLAAGLRGDSRRVGPGGTVFAEIAGGVAGTNLNLHGRLTDFQIVCPDESSSLPDQAQIPLDDLYAEHDPVADRLVLRSRRLGREVIPLYLGYLLPMALPEIPRTLLLLSPSSRADVDVWGGVPAGEAAGGVTCRPRVRYRDVVIARRRWTAAADGLPQHRPDAPEAERLLNWRRWQRDHAIPDQVFAQFATATDRSKPCYVDFTAWFSLSLLDTLLKAADSVIFEEMLPAEDQLYVTSPAGRHVSELAIEMTSWRDSHPNPGGTA
ncbi:MAG TPA: lantibiotic dehydratase [Streptosporangiaceae bacterium]|nr:lantibiotic dehydratase [Streptosporangiaceae bacterium]